MLGDLVFGNQIYGLTKGQLSPTSPRDLKTVASPLGALEAPVNPLLTALAYGAPLVAQGTPADMAGLAQLIEEAIRYPGFAFVNVQSPCVTFGEDDWQVKQRRAAMKPLSSTGHDAGDLLAAMDKARAYGQELHTGVFYRSPAPAPTYDALVRERQRAMSADGPSPARVLDAFLQK